MFRREPHKPGDGFTSSNIDGVTVQWLDDAFGPDGIRVTICVECAVDRLVRERDAWGLNPFYFFFRRVQEAAQSAMVNAIQATLLRDRYAVLIEADSGQRLRLVRPSHQEAVGVAKDTWHAVRERGVVALKGLA
jgi:hypothetical protein